MVSCNLQQTDLIPNFERALDAAHFHHDVDKGHALVVEDNHINQTVAREMLKALGYSVTLADNGKQALEVLASRGDDFDLILMDCQMPTMDGYQATLRIRQHLGDEFDNTIPIIALTANALPEDKLRCELAGMNGYVAKPIMQEELQVEIGRVLNNRRSEDQ